MATTTDITTSYAGEHSKKFISAALTSGVTLSNNLIEILTNVKYKTTVSNLISESSLRDAGCDFDANGTIILTERNLIPKELELNKKLCKKDYRDTWEAMSMGMSAHDVLPKTFADYLVALEIERVAADIESSIWNGDATVSGQFDGFATLLATDALLPAAQEVSGATLSATNISAELEKASNAIPTRLIGKPDMRLYISQVAMKFYVRSLGGFGANGLGANGVDGKGSLWYTGGDLMFDGIPLVVANGLTANQMIASEKTNLFFGTGMMSDQNEVQVIDTAATLGDQNVRIVMRMTAGVMYGNVTDIVTYGIPNSAN